MYIDIVVQIYYTTRKWAVQCIPGRCHVMVGAAKNNAKHRMYIFTIAACISPEVALGYNFHSMACYGSRFINSYLLF